MPPYDILAIRYGHAVRPRGDFLLHADPHDRPERIDYFIWLIRGGGRTVLVDTGFSERAARERGRTLQRSPADALAQLGVELRSITDVVITHLHYDHAGNVDAFPNAVFHLQAKEMAGATGPDMGHRMARVAFDVEDVTAVVRRVFDDRVRFLDGDGDLAPGITLHLIEGHTRGLQAVRVSTRRGHVVLASDAMHFYANMVEDRPFPGLVDLPAMLAGPYRALALADSGDHLIPGHDPLVLSLFPGHPEVEDVALVSEAPVRATPISGRSRPGR